MSDNPFLAMAGIKAPSAPQAAPDADLGGMASAAEQRYGLPSGLLSGLVHVESRGNPNAVSSQGAIGVAQFLPSTARSLGIDPTDPSQAIDGAGRLMRQNLDATGNVTDALKMYHGGTDRRAWGPKTNAYPGLVMGAMGQSPDPGPPAPPARNPFLEMAGNGTSSPDAAGNPQRPQGSDNPNAAGHPVYVSGGDSGSEYPGGAVGTPQPGAGQGGGRSGAVFPGAQASALTNFGHGLHDFTSGVARGVYDVAGTIGAGIDALGAKTGLFTSHIRDEGDLAQKTFAKNEYNPNGAAETIGRIGGNIAATAPLSELRIAQALGGGKVAIGAEMAAQGGAIGGLSSGGHDVGKQAAIGAVLSPVAGAVLGAGAKGVVAAADATGVSKVVQALRSRIDGAAPAAADASAGEGAAAVSPDSLPPLKQGQTIRTGADIAANPDPTPFTPGSSHADADGNMVIDVQGQPANTLADGVRKAAMGSRAARTGIEADTNWPQAVQEHVDQLMKDGLPADQALREARTTYAGAKPMLAHVTRDPADQRAMIEGAKIDTPEGQQLSTQIAANNQALHDTMQSTVNSYGGAPGPGEAEQAAAQSLANASDAARAKVTDLYTKAHAIDGEAKAAPDALHAVVNDPMNLAATTNDGKAFVNGMRQRVNILTNNGETGLGPDALEHLRQAANQAYSPVGGGEVNGLIGKVKDAVDQGFDQLGEAGPAYATARAAHRDWAAAYSNPDGVAKLIARDHDDNFVHADDWTKALSLNGNSTPFVQVVRQLTANGDQSALNGLKASVVQKAYEDASGRAGGTAIDQMGNSTVQGSKFLNRLNQIGKPKLDALFSPEEQGHLSTIGHAASDLNEAVPTTANTSQSSSALQNALAKMKGLEAGGSKNKTLDTALAIVGQGLGQAIAPGFGGVAIGAGINAVKAGVGAAKVAASQKVAAQAIKDIMTPAQLRASAQAAALREAAAARRASMARAIAARTPPVVGGVQQRR